MESSENMNDWSSGGEMVVSTMEEVGRVISEFEKDTISKFIVRRVDKGFGTKGQCGVIVSVFIMSILNLDDQNSNVLAFHVPSICLMPNNRLLQTYRSIKTIYGASFVSDFVIKLCLVIL